MDAAAYAGRMPSSPFDQHRYQVRHDWGIDGLRRLAPSDVVVVVDVLRFSTTVTDAVTRGESVALDTSAGAVAADGAVVAAAAAESGAVVLLGCLRNAAAVARAVLDLQHERAARTSIAVIAAGERGGLQPDAPLRFAVEDQLGAGAIVDALGERGVDHTSPEAAAACEAFRGLRGAVRHLLTASGSGQELLDRGARDEVLHAAEAEAAAGPDAPRETPAVRGGGAGAAVPILRDGRFVAF